MIENLSPSPSKSSADTNFILDISDDDFHEMVLRKSQTIPVIVDFWAPWCGPCKQLTPAIESAVKKANGAVILAKVNIDENPMIASQLRIQSVPMVYAFYQGQPVDGFSGNVPPQQIKSLIDKLITLSGGEVAVNIDAILLEAKDECEDKNFEDAYRLYAEILKEMPEHEQAIAGVIQCHIGMNNFEEAKEILENLPDEIKKHADISAAKKMLELFNNNDSADLQLLKEKASNKQDFEARLNYALARFAASEVDEAMDDLLLMYQENKEWEGQKHREQLLKMFEALGATDARVIKKRRQLSSLMFS